MLFYKPRWFSSLGHRNKAGGALVVSVAGASGWARQVPSIRCSPTNLLMPFVLTHFPRQAEENLPLMHLWLHAQDQDWKGGIQGGPCYRKGQRFSSNTPQKTFGENILAAMADTQVQVRALILKVTYLSKCKGMVRKP